MRRLMVLCLAGAVAGCSVDEGGNNVADANGAAASNQQASAQGNNVAEALGAGGDHSAFAQALQSAGLIETLRGAGPYTVFAPTNAAFEAIPQDVRAQLTSADQREQLIALLSYHIVPGTVTAEDLGRAIGAAPGGRAALATVTGDNLSVSRDGNAIVITDPSGAVGRVVRADQIHSNGVVHSIDIVLRPGD